jgi:hypothetical protein
VLQSREVTRQTGAAVSRSVTGLRKLDVPHPPYLHRRSGRQGSHSGSCRTGRSVRHHADTPWSADVRICRIECVARARLYRLGSLFIPSSAEVTHIGHDCRVPVYLCRGYGS